MDMQNNEPVMSGDYSTGGVQSTPIQPEKKGLAIASLVFGILSLIGFCCCGLNLLAAPLALIFGIIALATKRAGTGMAVAGIVMAILSLVIVGAALFSVRDLFPYGQEMMTDYMQVIADQDTVFPAYEEDGTLPDYLKKYQESPRKEVLQNHNVSLGQIMEALDQQYRNGQLPKYDFSLPDSTVAGTVSEADTEPEIEDDAELFEDEAAEPVI